MIQRPDFNPILALQLILDLYGQIAALQQQLQQVSRQLAEQKTAGKAGTAAVPQSRPPEGET